MPPSPRTPTDHLIEALAAARVLPVLELDDAATALKVCRALHEGGLRVVEITLRSPGALAALTAVIEGLPDLLVGAGTIRTPAQLAEVAARGAAFAVSPGLTPALIDAQRASGFPLVPGTATATEAMIAADAGFSFLKFFPAESSGGAAAVKSLAGPLADLRFCPTGGIRAETATAYLALPNVVCVGGSWLAPKPLVEAGDWPAIERLARAARDL